MARPIEYDLEEVLDNAMELFWRKGYENVSMAEIVEHTKLNRRTMYSLFHDKRGLFKEALDNYYAKRACHIIKILKANPGKKGIEIYLDNFSFDENFKGCFFTNCMVKSEGMCEETYNIPKDYFNSVQLQIEKNLEEESLNGKFKGNAKATALTIITFLHGFSIHGQYNHSKEDGEMIIKNILNLIQ